jgi:phage gpG-like protein
MSIIDVKVDATKIEADFGALPERLRQSVLRRVNRLTTELADRVRRKLSGEVLQVRSGDLRASIDQAVEDSGSEITGKVFSSGDVKYARIHEYGGTINHPGGTPYIITRDFGALFISKVTASHFRVPPPVTGPHQIPIPERSYLRSSLAEMRDQIVEELTKAVTEGLK